MGMAQAAVVASSTLADTMCTLAPLYKHPGGQEVDYQPGIVTGGVEEGEAPVDAAKRELQEELSLEAQSDPILLRTYMTQQTEWHVFALPMKHTRAISAPKARWRHPGSALRSFHRRRCVRGRKRAPLPSTPVLRAFHSRRGRGAKTTRRVSAPAPMWNFRNPHCTHKRQKIVLMVYGTVEEAERLVQETASLPRDEHDIIGTKLVMVGDVRALYREHGRYYMC